MASIERKGVHQKLKMLYLAKIISEETDDQHALTMPEILTKLAAYGVNADRRTIYNDFDELRTFGFDLIVTKDGHNYYYHLGSREFELPELKLLVDSVQSAKFITDKKSAELIHKLEGLVSKYEGKQLHRQVIISGRIKSMNESIYYNVDKLHEAIGSGCQIRFQYYQWNVRKEMELRREGAWYQVSPWALMWEMMRTTILSLMMGMRASSSTIVWTKCSGFPSPQRNGKGRSSFCNLICTATPEVCSVCTPGRRQRLRWRRVMRWWAS